MTALAGLASPASATGVIPEGTPIERIIQNVEARLKEHPDDAEAFYVLGRAHSLVLQTKNASLLAWNRRDSGLIEPAAAGWQKHRYDKDRIEVPQAELQGHLTAAITNLNRAIELNPGAARYRLALASALEAGLPLADQSDVFPLCPVPGAAERAERWVRGKVQDAVTLDPKIAGPRPDVSLKQLLVGVEWEERSDWRNQAVSLLHAELQNNERRDRARLYLLEDWREQIAEQYFLAMTLALHVDGKAASQPVWGAMENWVAYEAATQYVRLVEARKPRDDERIRLAVARQTVKSFEDLPMPNGVTPIVLRTDRAAPLAELINHSARSRFDLDGSGRAQAWPWLKPTTGLLCWDPTNTGRITSGRQLFGSVSWWLFFRNGYEALDALDDNRDGRLTGPELQGISVWFDRNSNAISDPGEVTPVQALGIRSLSCRATATSDGCPANPTGLTLADGRSLPTYDWIAEPLPDSESDKPGPRSFTPLAIAAALFAPLALRRRHA
ncbi:MAG: hypothetical protein IT436_11900 [Phycisphaerales bacterium]|nr:hypothetical protein [Phycisphaerales bacterium]